jgi:hypothetical protein
VLEPMGPNLQVKREESITTQFRFEMGALILLEFARLRLAVNVKVSDT